MGTGYWFSFAKTPNAIVDTASPPDVRKRLRPSVKVALHESGATPRGIAPKNQKSADGGHRAGSPRGQPAWGACPPPHIRRHSRSDDRKPVRIANCETETLPVHLPISNKGADGLESSTPGEPKQALRETFSYLSNS
ncbi:hypothetical protein BH20ACI3_BH20ACI3_34300 [soil metagenome]